MGHSVHTGCDVATHEQMTLENSYVGWGGEESVLVEGISMQLLRPMSDPQCDISFPSVALPVVGKMPKFSTFSGASTQKREVSFDQCTFKVRSVMQSHTQATLCEGNSMAFMWSCS